VKKVLIIKTSSLGDVIHTLPALTDAQSIYNDIQFDWVVEENFAEIPAWHPAVKQVIPVAIRRWRKHLFQFFYNTPIRAQWQLFKQQLQQQHYDYIIDAQGLLKSASLCYLARGERYGLDKNSARESWVHYFYNQPQSVDRNQHAVERVRQLFAQSLGYQLDTLPLDYGLNNSLSSPEAQTDKSIVFLHGTTWPSKHWPEIYWSELALKLVQYGYKIILPWGNDSEYQRALKIQKYCKHVNIVILDKMTLNELTQIIIQADAIVAVDTGLAHLAAALDKPTIALYGPTSAGLTGTYGKNQIHLSADIHCSPCFKKECVKTGSLNKEHAHNNNLAQPECYNNNNPDKVLSCLLTLLKLKPV